MGIWFWNCDLRTPHDHSDARLSKTLRPVWIRVLVAELELLKIVSMGSEILFIFIRYGYVKIQYYFGYGVLYWFLETIGGFWRALESLLEGDIQKT